MINTARCRIICVGKIKKNWIRQGLESYIIRMPGLIIEEIHDSNPKKESLNIKKKINKDEQVVLLNEHGESINSINFTTKLTSFNNKRLAFVIGGANGLHPDLNNIASWHLSISRFTFPHEIARLLLIEQIYRAQTISQGSPYHRN